MHEGRREEAIKKACDKANGACDQRTLDKGVLIGGGIEDQISKLYPMIFGGMSFLGGGGGPRVQKSTPRNANTGNNQTQTQTQPGAENQAQGTTSSNGNNQDNSRPDYCMYVAMGWEMVAAALQTAGQQRAQQDSAALNDPQLAALVNLQEAHRTRKRTATQQAAAYGVVSGCYVAQAFTGVKMDTKYILKMSAAGGLALLYKKKADKHNGAVKRIQEVIDGLPKAGDCNPWTGTSCFCKEKSSQERYAGYYQEVCVLNAGNFERPKADLGCTTVAANGNVAFDANCQCRKTNSCGTPSLSFGGASLGAGANFMNMANQGMALLDPSNFDEGRLGQFAADMGALSRTVKTPAGAVPDVVLTPDQEKVANELQDVVPPAVARLAATSPGGSPPVGGLMDGGAQAALSKLPETFRKKVGDEVGGGYRQGTGSNRAQTSGPEFAFNFPQPGQQEPTGGVEVVGYAEKALMKADVSNATDTPIFDIISNRYQRSGWNRLQAMD
jgi:hypothetical protein